MKRTLWLLPALLLAACGSEDADPRVPMVVDFGTPAEQPERTLVWSDEFDAPAGTPAAPSYDSSRGDAATLAAEDPPFLGTGGLVEAEAHRRAGWDVQAVTARPLAVEDQRRVGLVEVIVRADLHRAVAAVLDQVAHCHRIALVDHDVLHTGTRSAASEERLGQVEVGLGDPLADLQHEIVRRARVVGIVVIAERKVAEIHTLLLPRIIVDHRHTTRLIWNTYGNVRLLANPSACGIDHNGSDIVAAWVLHAPRF